MTLEEVACPDPPGIDALLTRYEGDLAFDVGANVGQSAKVLAEKFEQVVSFEPCEESFERLAALADDYAGVTPIMAAVSSQEGVVVLTEQRDHLARGQLTSTPPDAYVPEAEHGWGPVTGQREVPSVTLDGLVLGMGMPDLVKIDVEGHEVEVLNGAMSLILDERVSWFVECHSEELGAEVQRLLSVSPRQMGIHRHPHYAQGTVGWKNHYWVEVR